MSARGSGASAAGAADGRPAPTGRRMARLRRVRCCAAAPTAGLALRFLAVAASAAGPPSQASEASAVGRWPEAVEQRKEPEVPPEHGEDELDSRRLTFTDRRRRYACDVGYFGELCHHCFGAARRRRTALCTECPEGKYDPTAYNQEGRDDCEQCVGFARRRRSVACDACDPGRFGINGECKQAACPENSTGTSVSSGCECMEGFRGEIKATSEPPYYKGVCEEIPVEDTGDGRLVGAVVGVTLAAFALQIMTCLFCRWYTEHFGCGLRKKTSKVAPEEEPAQPDRPETPNSK